MCNWLQGLESVIDPAHTTYLHRRPVGTRSIRAYGCVHCQHLQLAVDFTEKDLQKYQQFEGEQPGMLEQINSDPD